MSARGFQTTTGIQQFRDSEDLGAKGVEPDSFFYDQTVQTIVRERKNGPLFIFSYLAANHFPWDFTYRPDLTPSWRKLGNAPNVDEYVRRQGLSGRDYAVTFRTNRSFWCGPATISPILPSASSIPSSAGRVRPALFHHVLRDRHRQFQTGRSIVGP